jgi:DNA-binding response OmpR family regulator
MSLNDRPVVLLVEDEPLIAIDIETAFANAGFFPATVSTTQAALDWLSENRPAVAVLDVRLNGETATKIASRLRQIGVPFLVHTGGAEGELPGEFQGQPHFIKPANYEDMTAVAKALAAAPPTL